MFNRLLLLGISLLLGMSSLNAQNYLQHKINKKLRTNAERVVNYLQANPDAKISELKATPITLIETRTTENAIDATAEAESELHAAINPLDSNNIIMSAMRQDPNNILSPLTFPTYYTKDFGETWELSAFDGTIDDGFVVGGGDPIIVFDTEGTAYICWLTLSTDLTFETTIALRYAVSTDGGATWTAAETPLDEGNAGSLLDILGGGVVGSGLKFVDKEWLAVDRSDSPYRNTIYASYLTIESEDGENIDLNITLRKKAANEERFTTNSVQVNTDTYKVIQFTSIDVDNEGTVHVSFAGTLDSLNWSLYHAQSTDGGDTFTQEKKVSDFHIPRLSGDEPESNVVGIDEQRLYPCPHLVVDKSGGEYDGQLYMVWTANGLDLKKTEGLDIYYARSLDGGRNWSDARVLNDDGLVESHQFYPSMTVNDKGTLIVSWYDRRDDANNLNTLYYLTYSNDGGETFEPSFPVSTSAADFSKIGSKNGNFGIGEYTQTVASDGYAIPIWADGRTNDGNIDLYVAFVPLDGVGLVSVNSLYKDFMLEGPFPNPAVTQAQFNLQLKEATPVQIELYNAQGQLMQLVQEGQLTAGKHSFELTDLTAGQYFLRIQTKRAIGTKKLIVVGQ